MAESLIFKQMIAQGQTYLGASGDFGIHEDPYAPQVYSMLDPVTQPYVLGVGGTLLTTDQNGNYVSETSFYEPTLNNLENVLLFFHGLSWRANEDGRE